MPKVAVWGLVVAAAVAAYHFSGPYRLAYDLHSAVKNRDAAQLEHVVDFQSIRSQLKQVMAESLSAELADNPFSVLALGLADVLVNKLVTPEVFLGTISGKLGGEFGRINAERLISSIKWRSLNSACIAPLEGSDCDLRIYSSGFDNWKLGIDAAAFRNHMAAAGQQ